MVWSYDYWMSELWRFQGENAAPVAMPPALKDVVVQSLTGDGDGGIFASFEHSGIWHLHMGEWQNIAPAGIPATPPLSLLVDSSGGCGLDLPTARSRRSSKASFVAFAAEPPVSEA
ncbi:MAG: hypothetical protein WDO73_30960 [Ignavibacteriota bacterium]